MYTLKLTSKITKRPCYLLTFGLNITSKGVNERLAVCESLNNACLLSYIDVAHVMTLIEYHCPEFDVDIVLVN